MFVGWSDLPPEQRNSFVAALYPATAFFHEAVVVFFVLSGFLVAGPNIDRARLRVFQLKSYSIDRVSRIYATVIPALVLTVLADLISRNLLGWTGFFDGSNRFVQERFFERL